MTSVSGRRRLWIATLPLVSALGTAPESFVRAIRTLPKCAHLPIVAVTGWARDDDRAGARSEFSALIVKPVQLDDMAATIARLVGESVPRSGASRSVAPTGAPRPT